MKCACSKSRNGKCCSNNRCGCNKNNRLCGSNCGCIDLPCHNKGQLHYPHETEKIQIDHSLKLTSSNPPTTRSSSIRSQDSTITSGLVPPSDEQMKIMKSCQEGKNIMVEAVAGSGKTTTSLHLAQSNPEKIFLLLTYNTKLKWETRQKARIFNLPNLEVHSFHAFVHKYLGKCYTDPMMIECLHKKFKNLPHYDILIIDECQDLKDFYYKLVCKIVSHLPDIQMILLGDRYQNVYRFLDSDERYLIRAPEVFNLNNRPWDQLTLSTSYRLTHETADFINRCLLGEDRIRTIKSGKKPRYIIDDIFSESPYRIVKRYLKKYLVDDIMILSRTLKSPDCPARVLANFLSSEDNIPIYLKANDSNDSKNDDKYMQNKILFTTFCSAKGLERKVVIIIGFDLFFPWDDVPQCPNDIYVACSRNIEKLVLLHNYKNDYLPYLERKYLKEVCHWKENVELDVQENLPSVQTMSVSGLISHLPTYVIHEAGKFFTRKRISPSQEYINIPIDIKCGDNYEPVSHLNGIAIPAYFQYLQSGNMDIYRFLFPDGSKKENFTKGPSHKVSECIDKEMKLITKDFNNLSNLLRLTNIYNCRLENLVHPLIQINHYDWLEKDKVLQCCERLKEYLTPQTNYEIKYDHVVKYEYQESKQTRSLQGAIDAIEGNIIYELKCVSELRDEHFLQLALYAWLYRKNHPEKNMIYRLLNILSGELYEIECDHKELDNMVKYLVSNKVTKKIISDHDFFLNINEMKGKFFQRNTERPENRERSEDTERSENMERSEDDFSDDEMCDMETINLVKDILIHRD